MRWTLTSGDILDERADVLVCSANVFLNLSGGVGGAILLRCGDGMQQELHALLTRSGKRHVERGDVVTTAPHGLPFRAVVHAVAVNGFYESSPAVITDVVTKSLRAAAALGAGRVALAALGTGFGRLSMEQFAEGLRPLLSPREFAPVDEVVICVKSDRDRAALAAALPELA
jgi:O-acetyl-ADP-ribose deacetylase